MAFEHKEGSGSLFKNGRKEKDNQPDYQGEANFEGVKIRLAGWLKEGKKGAYLSLKLQRADDAPRPKRDGDDIPF